jgi:diguanylate cyclase (GGDEF)-like protein
MTKQEQAALASIDPADEGSQERAAIQGYRLGDDFEQLKNARIMMIDDEPITMDAVQAFLEEAGYRNFVLLDDSTRAMQQLRVQRPDVLLLDVMMPLVSGFDILGMLRKEPEFAHLPVIILTSSSDAATKLQALDLGATDFLSKPVDPSELALRVRNTLGAKAYQDQLAYYDILTKLPNRRLFMDRAEWAIERARRADIKLAMLHLVFDGFKRVVDTLGPKTGDEVLKQVAQRLTKNIRGADVVGHDPMDAESWIDVFRVGSADFTVLAPSVRSITDAATIGQRLIEAMREPLDADGNEIYLSPSIGVAGYPDDGLDTGTLLKRAVGASSQALAQGSGRLQFYSAEMNQLSLRRLRMEGELRRAVEQCEFRLLYQPKVDVASGRIIGAEALLRWPRKGGEMVPPGDFIPVAEETGMILSIGELVLGEACRQLARWRDEGIDVQLSVNISTRQFFDVDMVSMVQRILAETAVEPARLVLEMTESLLMDRVELAISTMRELHALGVKISIDDFGTGYSSLAYLKRFKVNEVKIDRSFIKDVVSSREDRALIKAVTYLSHKLGARVCAEGVETPDQLAFLGKVNCDEYQGFLCSRPVPPQAFAALCRQAAAAKGPES